MFGSDTQKQASLASISTIFIVIETVILNLNSQHIEERENVFTNRLGNKKRHWRL